MIIKIDNVCGVELHGYRDRKSFIIPKDAKEFEIEKAYVDFYGWLDLEAVVISGETIIEAPVEVDIEPEVKKKKTKKGKENNYESEFLNSDD